MEILNVPLSSICIDPDNPRRGERTGIKELAASIKHVGLRDPLEVRKLSDSYVLIDGERRYLALKKLYAKNADTLVPVIVANGNATALEVAVAKSVTRVELHPVDEYEGYRMMMDCGMPVDDVAAHFGVRKKWVLQRLQLASLAPELREIWRKGDMNEDQAEALSAATDQKRQIEAWANAVRGGAYQSAPASIRAFIRQRGSISAGDGVFKLIGADAYEAAGGRFSVDLFEDEKYALDPEIVDGLVKDKLLERCRELADDGWKWVLTESDLKEKHNLSHWTIETLALEGDLLTGGERAILSAEGNWKKQQEAEERIIERLSADPAIRARTGVVVFYEDGPALGVKTLCVLPTNDDAETDAGGDEECETSDATADAETLPAGFAGGANEPKERVHYRLRESLSETLTIAVSKALAERPYVAIAALIATLTTELGTIGAPTPLRLTASKAWPGSKGATAAETAPYETMRDWARYFNAARDRGPERAVEALGRLVARLLDLRQLKIDDRPSWETERSAIIGEMVDALGAEAVTEEIRREWDAEAYFSSISADECKAMLRETGWTNKLPSGKKALVTICGDRAKARGWLPPELRMTE